MVEPPESLNPEEHFVRRLGEVRARADLSRSKLAARASEFLDEEQALSESALVEIETRGRRVKLNEAIALAAALDVAPVYLVFPIKSGPLVRIGWETGGGFERKGKLFPLHKRLRGVRPSTMRRWLCGHDSLFHSSPEGWATYMLREVPEALRRKRERKQRELERQLEEENLG